MADNFTLEGGLDLRLDLVVAEQRISPVYSLILLLKSGRPNAANADVPVRALSGYR